MSRRLGLALGILVLGAFGIAAAVLLTGGDDSPAAGGNVLAWEEPPLAFTPEDLPTDRVAYGTVRNASLDRLQASGSDFTVRDADGHELAASVQFLGTYAHGVYGAFQKPDPLPPEELSRLGFAVDLQTGQTAPLTVSYRLTKGSAPPATLFYRDAPALDLPAGGG